MTRSIPFLRNFIIEGNIGAGKSTFMRLVQDRLPVQIVFEPVDQWQRVAAGENLLDRFYQDTQRWAYTFQSYAFITRVIQQQKKALETSHSVQLIERSVYSDRYCFAKNCFEMGTMSGLEWSLYQEWFDWLIENYVQKPAGFIYLRTSPEKSYERLKKRARSEEKVVPLDYLQLLHSKHEQWLVNKQGLSHALENVPVLVIEADKEFENYPAQMEDYLVQIADFMHVSYPVTSLSFSIYSSTSS